MCCLESSRYKSNVSCLRFCYHLPFRVSLSYSLNPNSSRAMAAGQQAAEFLVELPPLTEGDPMFDKKMEVLKERGLKLQSCVTAKPSFDKCRWLQHILETARIMQLNEGEFYFLEDDERGPFSPRNEMAALDMIHSVLSESSASSIDENLEFLETLKEMVVEKLNEFGVEEENAVKGLECTREAERALFQWAKDHGVKTNICIADFEGYGRGTAAICDIEAGDLVLEIPIDIIISENLAMKSDMGEAFSSIGDIGSETIALLWSIRECSNPNSKYAAYFSSLPESFRTGLSFEVEGLEAVAGTLVFEQIMQAKEHLRVQYNKLFPVLSDSHPEVFPTELYTWERFLWASELWYSNSIKVGFPDGKVRTCLIPLLGLFNHSTVPHITRYSKIDTTTSTLKLFPLRSCKAGQQCFLSYGTLPNTDFLCFYGFVLKKNPYDTIPIELDMPEPETSPFRSSLVRRYNIGNSHMVRARWLSKSSLTKAGLPTKLLAALRVAFMEEDEAENFVGDPRHTMISTENERSVMEAILSTLEMLLQSVQVGDDLSSPTWDVVLATNFKESQIELLRSLYEPCSLFLQS